MSKTETLRKHAKKRLAQRLGMTVNRHDLRAMVGLIQSNKAIFLERQSNRVTLWELEYGGEKFVAAYDKNRKVIITALTLDMYYGPQPRGDDEQEAAGEAPPQGASPQGEAPGQAPA